jgi:hypothetical protein
MESIPLRALSPEVKVPTMRSQSAPCTARRGWSEGAGVPLSPSSESVSIKSLPLARSARSTKTRRPTSRICSANDAYCSSPVHAPGSSWPSLGSGTPSCSCTSQAEGIAKAIQRPFTRSISSTLGVEALGLARLGDVEVAAGPDGRGVLASDAARHEQSGDCGVAGRHPEKRGRRIRRAAEVATGNTRTVFDDRLETIKAVFFLTVGESPSDDEIDLPSFFLNKLIRHSAKYFVQEHRPQLRVLGDGFDLSSSAARYRQAPPTTANSTPRPRPHCPAWQVSSS